MNKTNLSKNLATGILGLELILAGAGLTACGKSKDATSEFTNNYKSENHTVTFYELESNIPKDNNPIYRMKGGYLIDPLPKDVKEKLNFLQDDFLTCAVIDSYGHVSTSPNQSDKPNIQERLKNIISERDSLIKIYNIDSKWTYGFSDGFMSVDFRYQLRKE